MLFRNAKPGDKVQFQYNDKPRRVRLEKVELTYVLGFDETVDDYRTFNLAKVAKENPLRFLGVAI